MTDDNNRGGTPKDADTRPRQGQSDESELKPPQDETDGGASTDVAQRVGTKGYIRYSIGVFVTVGLGFGLSFILLDGLASENGGQVGSGEFLVVGFFFAFLLGPILSSVTGTVIGLKVRDRPGIAAITSFIGSFGGFFVLVLLLVITGSIVGGEAGEASGEFLEDLLAIIGFGIGVAFVGGGTGYITNRFSSDD